MTTPSLNTPYRCIKLAMQDAGLIDQDEDPGTSALADNMGRLIDVLQVLQTGGLKLFLNQDVAVPLTAGHNPYVLSPTGDVVMSKPMRVIQAYYLYTTGVSRPITPLSWNEWLTLSQRTQQGTVTQYFVDKQATNLTVWFWLVPDTNEASLGQAHLLLQNQVTNVTNLNETMCFPQEWFMAARWNLAADLCTGQPAAVIQRCEQRAMQFKTALEDWDVEDTPTYFQVDTTRMYQGNTGRFR